MSAHAVAVQESARPSAAPARAARPAAGRSVRPRRVLVLEPQTAVRAVLAELIRRDDRFVAAGEAIEVADMRRWLDAAEAQPDLVVLSCLLDDDTADPWDVVAELRLRCPGARFVLTCPEGRATVVQAARAHGVDVLYATTDALGCLREALVAAALGLPYLSPRLQAAVRRRSRLSARGRQVLELMAEGASRPDIARRLGISEATVRSHARVVFDQLGVGERAHAVAVAMRTGLIA